MYVRTYHRYLYKVVLERGSLSPSPTRMNFRLVPGDNEGKDPDPDTTYSYVRGMKRRNEKKARDL